MNENERNLIVELCQCVTRDGEGRVTGIDVARRREVLKHHYNRERVALPLTEIGVNCGKLLMSTIHLGEASNAAIAPYEERLLESGNHAILQKLSTIHCVFRQEISPETGKLRYGLLGGIDKKELPTQDRFHIAYHEARKQLQTAIAQETLREGQALLQTHKQKTLQEPSLLNHSIDDLHALITDFIPDEDILSQIEHLLSPDVKAFCEARRPGRQAPAAKFIRTNTYYAQLDSEDTQRLLALRFSNDNMTIKALLECLSPDKFLNTQDFYCSVLGYIIKQVGFGYDYDSVEQLLKVITHQIIDEMFADIQANRLPSQLAGLAPQAALQLWKDSVAINFKRFLQQHPSITRATLADCYGFEEVELLAFDHAMEAAWAERHASLMEALPPALANMPVPQPSNNQVTTVQDSQNLQEAFEELCTDPISGETFVDPVVAVDKHFYSKAPLTRWVRERGTSPHTRQALRSEPLFHWQAFSDFIKAYQEHEDLSHPTTRQALLACCVDPLTQRVMQQPCIAVLQTTQGKQTVVCDTATLDTLRERNGCVRESREWDELKTIIGLLQQELPAPTGTTRLEWGRFAQQFPQVDAAPARIAAAAPAPRYVAAAAAVPTWEAQQRQATHAIRPSVVSYPNTEANRASSPAVSQAGTAVRSRGEGVSYSGERAVHHTLQQVQ